MEEKEVVLESPDPKTIPCLHCKWGRHNYLAEYCVKYGKKPDEVYYANAKCPFFEEIK